MAFRFKVQLDLPKASEFIKQLGVDPSGDVQKFHTNNVLKRIVRYMPFKNGALVKKTIKATDTAKPEIVTLGDEAAFLYFGKVMVGDETGSPFTQKGETKHVVESWDINYNKEKNIHAGPFWDKALAANEGDALVEDLQRYLNFKLGK